MAIRRRCVSRHSWGFQESLYHFVSCSTASSCSKRWPRRRWLDHVQNKAADDSEDQCQAEANRDIKSQTAHRGFLICVIVCGLTYSGRLRRRFGRRWLRWRHWRRRLGLRWRRRQRRLGLRGLGLRGGRWQQGIAGIIFVEHGALVAPPIGINAGMRLTPRQMHSYTSRRRLRKVRRRTIIEPIIAPSVLGRPHMMRHHDLPSNAEARG